MARHLVSFSEYATYNVILRLITKERAKYAVKNFKRSLECADKLYLEQLKPLMPPRKQWICPPAKLRPTKGKGLSSWTYDRKKADARLAATIRFYRSNNSDVQWLKNLNGFILEIQDIIAGKIPFDMEKPKVIPVYKKYDKSDNTHIFRPICVYSDLKTKILLALTYKYLLYVLNDQFHCNMLFMRSAMRDKAGHRHTPNFIDAIELAKKFRAEHNADDIYVGECDIQKFYDIINHDVILDCLDSLFKLKSERSGVDVSLFESARNIMVKYLESFNYYDDVWKLNDQGNRVWAPHKRQLKTDENPDPVCKFGWVSDADFICSGCYDAEGLEHAKKNGLLGIPQGGALSGIIVNVIMQCIDCDIVSPKDPGRLFVRFCDDILLMHTNQEKCQYYLDLYLQNLKKYKLVPHRQISVSEFKNGTRTQKGFWGAKSKNVFKWGSGSGEASDWISFVGYEMRRTGEIRIRKDKIDEQFRHIAHKYYQVINIPPVLKEMIEHEGITDDARCKLEKRLEKFNSLAPQMEHFVEITHDRYTQAQGRHIDKYLKMKVHRAANKLKIDFPENLTLFETVM